ncbi:glycosyltransferase family 8 protein [Synechococcus sp. AH-229-G18]|nr:glycosyltransferase family 8 protein [Synechococcus sp. AH-229-G18]
MHKTFLYCTDDNYAVHATVSIFSLLISTSSRSFDICIIGDNLSEKKVSDLSRLGEVFQIKINIIEGADYCEKYINFLGTSELMSAHITRATLLRLAFHKMLPAEYEKIIYIDVDTIIRGDLSCLFDVCLDDEIIAAAADLIIGKRFKDEFSRFEYFNAGVMVIDRVAWEQHGVDESLVEIMSRESALELTYADQDILNIYFNDSGYKKLDCRYNYQFMMAIDHVKHSPGVLLGEAKIIHYAGQVKPWHLWASEEYASFYCSFRKIIPWLESYSPEAPTNTKQLQVAAKTLLAQGRFEESAIYSQKMLSILKSRKNRH